MSRLMNKIFRVPRLPNIGQIGLAKYKPWLQGKIGRIERRVSYALIGPGIKGTGQLVREIYHDEWDKDAPPFKPQRWMYLNVRKACVAIGAVRIGRGEGWGSPVLWAGSKDDFYTVRARKKTEYAKRRRKRVRDAARKIDQ
jgi:hypothetical protein